MKLLVDTQSLIWFVTDDPLLRSAARIALESDENDLSVSPASFWEMGIKLRIDKLTLPIPFAEFIRVAIDDYEIRIEPILPAHAQAVAVMPLHHRDPFDRMIAAQTLHGRFTLISSDPVFDTYGVPRLW